jgi:hypothetical protein
LNAVNPLYQLARGGADTYMAAERGNYRAAGATGVKTVVLGAAVGYSIASGVTTVMARAPGGVVERDGLDDGVVRSSLVCRGLPRQHTAVRSGASHTGRHLESRRSVLPL